jgi:hypothetical protein
MKGGFARPFTLTTLSCFIFKGETRVNTSSRSGWSKRATLAFTVALLLVLSTTALASAKKGGLLKLSSDPFTNKTSQHKTQVEPDTYSFGSTIVSDFQSGRFFDGGSSDNGWATSTDNGKTWHNGFLPGTTVYSNPPGKYDRISDPSVSYDAKHNTWITSGLAIIGTSGAAVLVNQSTDGGLTWQNAVTVATTNGFYDKDWIVCDDTSSSKFYGNCYVEWDDADNGDSVLMSTSSDGGNTWSAPSHPANAFGLGGQPLVQPNGNVIVPFFGNGMQSFMSTNGGKSWGNLVTISTQTDHQVEGNMRSEPLPSAEIDGSGTVYVAWHDCRFESGCSTNDIVYSTSSDGTHWSTVQRVPTNPVGSGEDNFIPGIAVDKSTSGSSAHIAVTYYFFPNANCSNNCQLEVGYVSSTNGGSTWSASTKLAGPMNPTWLANTNQGRMVGDYISTSILANGNAFPVFAVAKANKGSKFNEAMYTAKGGLPVTGGTIASNSHVLYTGSSLAPTHLTAF